jgi:hypothetical protein
LPRRARTWTARTIALAALATLLTLAVTTPAHADPVVSISGTVTVDGVATAGLTVTASTIGLPPTVVSATTGAGGHYELLDVPEGFYTLDVDDPGSLYQPVSGFAFLNPGSPTATVNLTVLSAGPATGVIHGVVTVDGVATEGLTVQASVGLIMSTATSGPDGSYAITGLSYGTYNLNVFDAADEFQNLFIQVVISAAAQDVVRDVPVERWQVGTSTVSGTLTDRDTDLPLEGFSVSIGGDEIPMQSALTGADGTYAFTNLPGGVINVFISPPTYRSENRVLTVLDGETVTADFALAKLNATIVGTVRDGDDNPVPFLFVRGVASDGGSPVNTIAGPTGEYSLGPIAAGEYTLTVGGLGTSWTEVSHTVTAIADDTVTRDFQTSPRVTGSINGLVMDATGTSSLESICVTAYDSAGDVSAGAGMDGTASDGLWSIDDLDVGDYRLLFWDCDYARDPAYATTWWGPSPSLAGATPVTVTAGGDLLIGEMRLSVGGTIGGHIDVQTPDGVIEFPSGRGMDATVFQLVGGTWEAVPDESPLVGVGDVGDYQARGLLPGTYRVGFVDQFTGPRAYETEYYDDVLSITSADDIVVTAGATVTGIDATVLIPQPDGSPFAVPTESLAAGDEDEIAIEDESVSPGEELEVIIGQEYAGEWVSVWGHSTPVLMGNWVQVSSTGTVTVTVPAGLPGGTHSVVAQDADGAVIGWTGGLQVTALGTSPAQIAATGATTLWLVPVGAGVVFAGLLLLRIRRARA